MVSLVKKLQHSSAQFTMSPGCTACAVRKGERYWGIFRERMILSHWSVADFTPAQSVTRGGGGGAADYGNELLTSSVTFEYALAMKSSGAVTTVSLFRDSLIVPLTESYPSGLF